jgi:hypothetical protein
MNPELLWGTRIVVLTLIAYSIGFFIEQKTRLVRSPALSFLTLGLMLDIAATVLMIVGSARSPFSMHGVLGYSALFAMLLATVLLWRNRSASRPDAEVPSRLHLYLKYAYAWWIFTFVVGGLLAVLDA